MFHFLKKIFKKKDNLIYDAERDHSIKSQIMDLRFDNERIIATNIDGVEIKYFYKDILAVYIIVDGSDYLPQPRWTIQKKDGGINIYNDIKNADILFFKILNEKLDGYNSDETQHEILKALGCIETGYFSIWERHDAEEILKTIRLPS
ncbi:hypothetical protein [Acinetobacter larvae]|uniref:Uncharacterized protein n=1 Tax=Acinetobacter larvae TaxID=1789224 RepID=A0A1B2M165_9GAMM|nr:hypothetical protein [Acinetobacter larvae]AOA58909.1 hypothetical protein BFG52_11460 [Acinetobacter larvae]